MTQKVVNHVFMNLEDVFSNRCASAYEKNLIHAQKACGTNLTR